jgi:hypothetical protein
LSFGAGQLDGCVSTWYATRRPLTFTIRMYAV